MLFGEADMRRTSFSSLPVLDLSLADDKLQRPRFLQQLHKALFDVGFLYIVNHGVAESTIKNLTSLLPRLFDLPIESRGSLTKLNSPHFLGYSGFAEETTAGKQDLREQFDFATELPVVWQERQDVGYGRGAYRRDFTRQYWRLRGPNQWPPENMLPKFREAFTVYHDAVATLSYRFVHLVEEAFNIPIGTFDHLFVSDENGDSPKAYLPAQHRIKLLKYPPSNRDMNSQGVGAHKDSSGWLTFLYQVGNENALEVMNGSGDWIPAPPIDGSFVVNFGNAFEAATEGAVRATVHRVKATSSDSPARYSIPFFQGLPLDLTVSEIRSFIPESVRRLRRHNQAKRSSTGNECVSNFLDPRWDNLGESQLRKWIRSHQDVGREWYGDKIVDFYLQ